MNTLIGRYRYLPWVLVLVPFLFLAIRHWTDGPGLNAGDYAHYLLHARSLAEGRAYNDVGYIFTRYNWVIGPPAQPPGLPFTLVPVMALFGAGEAPAKVVILLFSLVFILAAGRYFARQDDRHLGVGVALITGLSSGILRASTQVGSDLPFAALLWIVIGLVDKPGGWRFRHIVMIAVAGGLAMSYRVVGGAIVPALLIFGLLNYRQHRLKPLAPLAIWAAALGLAVLALPLAADLVRQVSFNPIQGLGANSWGMLKLKLFSYRLPLFDSHLYPFPWNALNDVYHLVSVLVAAVGFIAWIRHAASRFLVVFTAVYMLALFLVPVQDARYLWPVYPVFVFSLLNGIKLLLQKLRGMWVARHAAPTALAVAVVLALLTATVGPEEPRRLSLARQPEVSQLFAWLRERSSEESMRVVFFKPRVLAWETRIPAMGQFVMPGLELQQLDEQTSGCTPNHRRYVEHLRENGITHVVSGDFDLSPRSQHVLEIVVRSCPDYFSAPLFQNERFLVYRFVDGQLPNGTES